MTKIVTFISPFDIWKFKITLIVKWCAICVNYSLEIMIFLTYIFNQSTNIKGKRYKKKIIQKKNNNTSNTNVKHLLYIAFSCT